jgi:hypothetical protein
MVEMKDRSFELEGISRAKANGRTWLSCALNLRGLDNHGIRRKDRARSWGILNVRLRFLFVVFIP